MLQAKGLKSGGTLAQRAQRLFLTKDTPLHKLDRKHFAPGAAPAAALEPARAAALLRASEEAAFAETKVQIPGRLHHHVSLSCIATMYTCIRDNERDRKYFAPGAAPAAALEPARAAALLQASKTAAFAGIKVSLTTQDCRDSGGE